MVSGGLPVCSCVGILDETVLMAVRAAFRSRG
jgi:bacterioferritin-associated ferredoxin